MHEVGTTFMDSIQQLTVPSQLQHADKPKFLKATYRLLKLSKRQMGRCSIVVPYLRQQQGELMTIARQRSRRNEQEGRRLWSIGSIYAMASGLVQNDDYTKAIHILTKINQSSSFVLEQIIRSILVFLVPLSKSLHSHLVVQAAIRKASPTLFIDMFKALIGSFAELNFSTHGSSVIRVLLRHVNATQRVIIVNEMRQVSIAVE